MNLNINNITARCFNKFFNFIRSYLFNQIMFFTILWHMKQNSRFNFSYDFKCAPTGIIISSTRINCKSKLNCYLTSVLCLFRGLLSLAIRTLLTTIIGRAKSLAKTVPEGRVIKVIILYIRLEFTWKRVPLLSQQKYSEMSISKHQHLEHNNPNVSRV